MKNGGNEQNREAGACKTLHAVHARKAKERGGNVGYQIKVGGKIGG